MSWLLALILSVVPAWAQEEEACDTKALVAELAEASPVAVPGIYANLVKCDADKGKALAEDAMSRTLAGDAGNTGAEAAISVGAGEEVRTWLEGLEPDQRSRTIAHMGKRCGESEHVAQWMVESHDAMGEQFWRDRWYRGLADCRTEGIQSLLAVAIDGDVAGKGASDRHRFRGLLEVYARNLGRNALPKLAELALTLESEDDIVFVVNAYSDAANLGALEGADPETMTEAIRSIQAIGGQLPPKAVDQARITLQALGDEAAADRFARYRWPDRKVDGVYRYMAVAIEDYTCKNGKQRAVFHYAEFTEAGSMWPEQVKALLAEKVTYEWELEAQAEKCKGEVKITVDMPSEPLADDDQAKKYLDAQRQVFLRQVQGYNKASEEEHPAFEM